MVVNGPGMFCLPSFVHFDGIGEKTCAEHHELNRSHFGVVIFALNKFANNCHIAILFCMENDNKC